MHPLVFGCVVDHLHDSRDRDAVSLVCKNWYHIEANSRSHLCISTHRNVTFDQVIRRYKNIKSLKLKVRLPEAERVGLWNPLIIRCLREIHFRRIVVSDLDIELISISRGHALVSIKLDRCSGFSTDGLFYIARHCKKLTTLDLEGSHVTELNGEWVHELAVNNGVLETLNFYLTELVRVNYQDLTLLARKCPLVSVKICAHDLLEIAEFFRAATALQEFCGGSFNVEPKQYSSVLFPETLRCLGLTFMSRNEMPIMYHFASRLTKLDLLYAFLDTKDHCELLPWCLNLEVLETSNYIGNSGLEVLASHCRKIRRLRIKRNSVDEALGHEGGHVTHEGLSALAHGCIEMEFFDACVSDITNKCFKSFGAQWKNLKEFCLVLLNNKELISDLPFDVGFEALVQGCEKLSKCVLLLRPRALAHKSLRCVVKERPKLRLRYVTSSSSVYEK